MTDIIAFTFRMGAGLCAYVITCMIAEIYHTGTITTKTDGAQSVAWIIGLFCVLAFCAIAFAVAGYRE